MRRRGARIPAFLLCTAPPTFHEHEPAMTDQEDNRMTIATTRARTTPASRNAINASGGLGRLGGVYALLHAGHTVGDYWVQTGRCSEVKGEPGRDGQIACAIHVATLTATQAAFLGLGCLATGERLSIRRVAAGLTLNAASHYAMDRREQGVMPIACRVLKRFGKDKFALMGKGSLASGAAFLDQAWHIGWAGVSAMVISGR